MGAYWYRVEIDHKEAYDGNVAADAMAAWSTAVSSAKAEYICFETIRSPDEQLGRLEYAREDTSGATDPGTRGHPDDAVSPTEVADPDR